MLLAQDLLLLLLDDESGKIPASLVAVDKGLAGAVLVELAMLGVADVAGEGDAVKPGRIVVRDGPGAEHPVLLAALGTLREKEGRKPDQVLGTLAKGLRDRLVDGLVADGVLRREKHKVLGLFPTRRLPAADPAHQAKVRADIRAVLLGDREPDQRTGPLIGLLSALDAVTKVVDVPDKRTANKRAKEIAKGQWAAAAVRKAVAAVHATIVIAAAGSSTAGGG